MNKKIVAFDYGHGGVIHDRGSNGFCNEYQKNKEVMDQVIKYAKEDNLINFIVINPPFFEMRSIAEDIKYRCTVANKSNADILVSLHHNYGGGLGTEIYSLSADGMKLATYILSEYVKMGYSNRGVKSAEFALLKHTNMVSCLIKGWFIDSSDYKKFNAKEEARAILTGIYKYFGLIDIVEERYYTVELGDTLWRISKTLGIAVEFLKERNAIRDVNFIRIGQKIYY